MSFTLNPYKRVDLLLERVHQLEKKVDVLTMLIREASRTRRENNLTIAAQPVQVGPAGKIEPSVAPVSTKRPAYKTTAVRPRAGDPATFYEQMGGYTVVSRYTEFQTFVRIHNEAHRAYKQKSQWRFQFFTGYGRHVKRKGKMFATRLDAEQFAFDVLKIHEAECIARKKPTDWWNRVKIFEVIKR